MRERPGCFPKRSRREANSCSSSSTAMTPLADFKSCSVMIPRPGPTSKAKSSGVMEEDRTSRLTSSRFQRKFCDGGLRHNLLMAAAADDDREDIHGKIILQ